MAGKLRNRFLILLTEKERREERRVTLKEVAQATDINEHTIARWFRNDVTKFEAVIVEKLIDYFECHLCDLLYMDVSDNGEPPS